MEKGSLEYLEFRKKANERNRRYYSKPEVKAKRKIYKKQHDLINKDKIRAYGFKLRATQEYKNRVKKWREDNKDLLKIKAREWRLSNKGQIAKKDKEYRIKNRDKIHLYNISPHRKEWRKKHKEDIVKSRKKYNKTFKGKINYTKLNHKRLSIKHNVKFNLTSEQIKQLFNEFDSCVYCGRKNRLEIDHIIPISKGGKTIMNNLVMGCRICNPSKANKDVFEWCKSKGYEVPNIVKQKLNVE